MRSFKSTIAVATAIGLVLCMEQSAAVAAVPGASQTQLVSLSQSATPGSADSFQSVISANGKYVAFASASQLTSTPHASGTRQIYVRDTASGSTTMVSTAGLGSADGDAVSPSISADGRFVAYISNAANLGVRGNIAQAMLWSRDTGTSRVLSLSGDPIPNQANSTVLSLELSADGSTAAFSTKATNLAGADTRSSIQVYTVGVRSGRTTLISRDPAGTETTGGAGDSSSPTVSADGGTVAFTSFANLGEFTSEGHRQIYVRRPDGAVQLVSVSTQTGQGANRDSDAPDLSGIGYTVAFESAATDLTDEPIDGVTQIYVRRLDWSITRLASYNTEGTQGANRASDAPVLSDIGDVVAFESIATDLSSGATSGSTQIYSRNLTSGEISLVSATPTGDFGAGISNYPSIAGDGRLIAFESSANDLTTTTPPGGIRQIYLRNTRPASRVERIGGADRFEVSAHVSAASFAPHVPVAFIASGAVFADALSGAAAAGYRYAPVLLASRDDIPASVASELRRLQPAKIVILGGTNSIGTGVETALAGLSGQVERIAGADRYEVSAAISASIFPLDPTTPPIAFIASGAVFPDALSGSALAGDSGGPVLLAQKDVVPAQVIAELHRLAPRQIMVLGGVNTISESVVATLGAIAPTSRIGGSDRYEVSANASSRIGFGATGGVAFVASGEKFPDALAGSPAAIRVGAPVLLVTSTSIPASVAQELGRLKPTKIVVLGGPNTVSDPVVESLKGYLAG